MEHTLHRDEEGVENGTDADSSQQHRHKILLGRVDGRFLGLIAFAEILQIAVDDHDGIVDHHSQHHNQCCQRHDVQFDAGHIHNGY